VWLWQIARTLLGFALSLCVLWWEPLLNISNAASAEELESIWPILTAMGLYILFVEGVACIYYCWIGEPQNYLNAFKRGRVLRCRIQNARSVKIEGEFNKWQPKCMQEKGAGWWEVRLPLRARTYKFRCIVDGVQQLANNHKTAIGTDGSLQNVIDLSEVSIPEARLTVRNTFIQVLLAVAAAVLAFSPKDESIIQRIGLIAVSIAVLSGIIYAFILSGVIVNSTLLDSR
jgi:Glycogen recognition site of AMP-activated protein kinase